MNRQGLAVAFLPCALACGGGVSADPHGDGGAASSSKEGGASIVDAASSSDADMAPDQSASDAAGDAGGPYSGYVIASVTSNKESLYYAFDTKFWSGFEPLPGPPNTPLACGTLATTQGACCEQQIRLGLPVQTVLPVAGNVSLYLHGKPVATLLSPDYTEITSAFWNGGDLLGVSAAGGDVAAFSGTLVAPVMVAGLSPDFGQASVAIAHDTDFRVSWTPEGKDGEIMQLQIDVLQSSQALHVLCTVPDSAGSVVVDASLLAPLVPAKSATIDLARTITSTVAGPNATVSLVGNVWVSAQATIQ